jgi:hypothetical protein
MSTYRVEFDVKADLVLEPGSPALVIDAGEYRLELRNGKPNKNGDATNLTSAVIGPNQTQSVPVRGSNIFPNSSRRSLGLANHCYSATL